MLRILSLDIGAGVFCGYTFAGLILGCGGPPVTPVFLCGTVWVIYTLDHLLDARSLGGGSTRPAYRWHHENRKWLWPLVMVTSVAMVALSVAFLPGRILAFGFVLGALVGIYSLIHQGMVKTGKKYLFKEGWISILYTAGVWGVPLLCHWRIPDTREILVMIVYGLLVLTNVLIYSYHECYEDRRGSKKSMATEWGRKNTSHVLRLLILTILSMIMALFLISENRDLMPAYIILLCMVTVLGGILAFPGFFGRKERYGLLADGAFLLPGLLIWLG